MRAAVRRAQGFKAAPGAFARRRSGPAPSAPRRRRANTGRRSRARPAGRPGCSRGCWPTARTAGRAGAAGRLARRSAGCCSASIAERVKAGVEAPDSTAQAWAIRSMRHSSLASEPSGAPLSKKARRNQAPSQPASCSAATQPRRASSQRWARASSPRIRAKGTKPSTTLHRNQPSQTDSPRPSWPTRFMPSFQSPVPISGRPWLPTARLRSMVRAQCS